MSSRKRTHLPPAKTGKSSPSVAPETTQDNPLGLDKPQLKELMKLEREAQKLEKTRLEQEERERLARIQAEQARLQAALDEQTQRLRQRGPTLTRDLGADAVEGSDDPAADGLLQKFRRGLAQTRHSLGEGLTRLVLGKKTLDAEVLAGLEELLLTADMGVETTTRLLALLQQRVQRHQLGDAALLRQALKEEVVRLMARPYPPLRLEAHKPAVVMFVGVNGVGKTTTIGKVAQHYCAQGKKVLLAAGDTFRAAAAEQLTLWSQRSHADVLFRDAGTDPSAVIHQAVKKGLDEGYDLVLCDTAGRLHTKVNLMEELKKMKRVAGKLVPGAPHETWLVLDANTGQNAIHQTRQFHQAVGLSGLIVTKLDGTARGGVIVGIHNEFQLPIRFVGLGEAAQDLEPFDPHTFAEQML